MKTSITVLVFILFANLAMAKKDKKNTEIEKEINNQVWKPFKKALEDRDWEKYNNLHTDDVFTVSRWGIKTGDAFKAQIKQWYQKKDSIARTFDLWFEYRVYEPNTGCEVGYYRIINESPDGVKNETFGRFHVILKRINNEWKIQQDWDTDMINEIPISAEDFNKKDPLKW